MRDEYVAYIFKNNSLFIWWVIFFVIYLPYQTKRDIKMITLTIINSIVLFYLLLKGNKSFYFTFKSEKTSWEKTLLGYSFIIWKRTSAYGSNSVFYLFIPVRNRRKTELEEEVRRLIADSTNRRYSLNAKFSWLKTWEQVRQFEKDYTVVDRKQVEELVSKFVPKN